MYELRTHSDPFRLPSQFLTCTLLVIYIFQVVLTTQVRTGAGSSFRKPSYVMSIRSLISNDLVGRIPRSIPLIGSAFLVLVMFSVFEMYSGVTASEVGRTDLVMKLNESSYKVC